MLVPTRTACAAPQWPCGVRLSARKKGGDEHQLEDVECTAHKGLNDCSTNVDRVAPYDTDVQQYVECVATYATDMHAENDPCSGDSPLHSEAFIYWNSICEHCDRYGDRAPSRRGKQRR